MKHSLLVPLNRQQLELVDRTVARGVAPDRAALLRLALREYAAEHAARSNRASTPAATSKEAS
jgi:hypothetical protein